MGLELVGQGHNLVISTGTASGKSLVFQAPALHHLVTNPNATAIAIYPIKALARDQVIRWQEMAEAAGLDPESINRIDGDVRDLTERRQDPAADPVGPDDPRRDPAVADGLLGASLRQTAAAPRPPGGPEHPVQRAPVHLQPGSS